MAHNQKSGIRCERKCIIGFEYGFTHLPIEKHLRIADSEIQGAGKGLFAKSISESAENKDKKLKQLSRLNSLLIQLNDYKFHYITYHAPVNKVVKPTKAKTN